MRRSSLSFWIGPALLLAACKSDPPGAPPGAGGAGTATASTTAPGSAAATATTAAAEAVEASPVAGAGGQDGPPDGLSVLLLTIDSLRADMPWAGYERDIAPRLTALEKTCVSYTQAYSASSFTAKSVPGFLSGRVASELKRDGYFFARYATSNTFITETAQQAGIFTLAAQAHGYFSRGGFEQGFDRWEILPGLKWNPQTDENITGEKHVQTAQRLLSDPEIVDKGRPFFAWFHLMDPHDLYQGHERDGIEPFGKKPRDRYDGEVLYTDRQIGKLLDFIATQPYAKKLAILVSSDHGEAFGEHGRTRHGFELWQTLVRVPLFLCLPGAEPKHIDQARSGLDLAPTILDLLKVKADPASFRGKSLVPEAYGQVKPEERDVVIDLPQTSTNGQRRALIHGRYKIIQFDGSVTRVFDLQDDPLEEKPLSGEIADDMRARLKELNASIKEEPPTVCGKGCLHGTK